MSGVLYSFTCLFYLFTLYKVGLLPVRTKKINQKMLHMIQNVNLKYAVPDKWNSCKFCMLNKCMIGFYFSNGLNSSRDWHSFKFVGKLFHNMLPLNFNKFILYLWLFVSGTRRGTPLLREYGICLSMYVFHMKFGLSVFLDLFNG